ncbi:MAG: hypothetical protein GY828_08225, partial [Candidatus Gracilibacteria bacterium]|nr:hypothetical protein [Candidatus Gracilibacteria bacterium]
NYNSLKPNNKSVGRTKKLSHCHNIIINLLAQGKVTDNDYVFLIPLLNHIVSNPALHHDSPERKSFLKRNIQTGRMVLFKLK